jgi:Protein of unknown function (DUF2490)
MKVTLAFLFTAGLYFNSFAQNPTPLREFHIINNGWTDFNVTGKIKGKLLWQIENQHRREDMQGDYNEATKTGNPYKNLNQHLFRPYLHYQLNPNIRFSLMPMGWIGSNRFKDGKPSAFFSELRMAPQVILTQNIGRIRFDNRFRYEFRWIGKNKDVNDKNFIYGGDYSTTTFKERFRYQVKMTIPLNKPKMDDKTVYIQAYNELFVNIGKNIPNINIFDQNRVMVGLGYKFNKFVAVEAGFMRQSIYRFNNTDKNNVDRNNILQTNLAISNFEGLFKKK